MLIILTPRDVLLQAHKIIRYPIRSFLLMKTGISIFKSKVAKRIFLLFLTSAMLPIGIFSGLAFYQVSTQLKEQSISRLQNNAKSYGLILFERFSMLDTELSLFVNPAFNSTTNSSDPIIPNTSSEHFDAVAFVSPSNEVSYILGDIESIPDDLTGAFSLDAYRSVGVIFGSSGVDTVDVFLVKALSNSAGGPGVLVGKINSIYLWGIGHENILPPWTEATILDQTRNIIFSSFSLPESVLHQIRFTSDG